MRSTRGSPTLFSLALLLLATGVLLAAAALALDRSSTPAEAATVALNPSKDNTLYQYFLADGDRSNGKGDRFFAGTTDQGRIRRGVLAFNLASIPAGSTITSVTLTLNMSRTNAPATAWNVELHKLTADWGEGTSNPGGQEGQGNPATTNDATWQHRFFNTILWTTQGGDFSATVSAGQSVVNTGTYTWGSTSQMVADVQSWLDSPTTNFGWLVKGDESTSTTAKRFDTRESSNPPVLTINYTPSASTPTPTATGPTPSPTASPTPTASPSPTPNPFVTPLYAPPVLTSANINISIDEACVQLLPTGPCTNMWTYGGTFPGATIRRPTGQTTNVTFTNNLDPAVGEMTVHNHGNHSSPENDGRPDDELIPSGGFYTYSYQHIDDGANERGAPQFYHDHRDLATARNVWMGLAGFYILDDPADPQTLPSGGRDIPLGIMDRTFDAQNQIPYTFDNNGVIGDRILVNGRHQPYLEVEDTRYRFRVLNGSNTRVYNLVLSGAQPLDFTQIGTGAGLLPAPVTRTELRVGPGERADVVVGFAPYQAGNVLHLRDTNKNTDILEFRVTTNNATDSSIVPGTLRPLPDVGEPTVTRAFTFGKTANHWTINGLLFDPNRVDFQPVQWSTERWVISNAGGAVHTFHVHDVEPQCISRNSGPCLPHEKFDDTYFLGPNETIELKMKFTDFTGRYVFHCHVLEHEQDGMMLQFEVIPDTDRDGTPDVTDLDDDNDSWTDAAEADIGTDPLVKCGANGWPPDINSNQQVQIDDVAFAAGAFNSTTTPRAEIASQNGNVQIDDIVAFAGRFGDTCTP